MKKHLISLIVGIALLSFSGNAKASVIVTVKSQAGPWVQALNPGYDYGVFLNGQDNVNLPPAIVDSSSGLAMNVHDLLTIQYLDGLANAGGGGIFVDANGTWSYTTDAGSPSHYVPAPGARLAELMGVFATSGGVIVNNPFVVGNGPFTIEIPDGAAQLQLGFNDGWYNDNYYSTNPPELRVTVAETPGTDPISSPAPEPASLIFGATALASALGLRRKK